VHAIEIEPNIATAPTTTTAPMNSTTSNTTTAPSSTGQSSPSSAGSAQAIRSQTIQQKREVLEQQKADFRQLKQAYTKQKCALMQQRLTLKHTNYEQSKLRHANAYQNLKNRLEKASLRLSDKGYDVVKLNEDIKTLNIKIVKFSDDYSGYMLKLKETNSYACGHSEGEFRIKLLEAKELLEVVKQDSVDIKNYYSTVIRPEIVHMIKTKDGTKTNTGTNSNGSTGTNTGSTTPSSPDSNVNSQSNL
jgi:hypothetical protein